MCFESHLGANSRLIVDWKYSCSIPFPLSGQEIRTVQEHGLVVLSEFNKQISAANAQQRRHMSLRNASRTNLEQHVWLEKIIYCLTFFQLCLLIFSTVFSNMLFINSTNLSTLTLKMSAFLINRLQNKVLFGIFCFFKLWL